MTQSGFDRLQEELKRLKAVDRPRVIQALEAARSHGDLSENAEYDAARHEQGLIERRISELEVKTQRAQVIDLARLSGGTVRFGALVTLRDLESGEKLAYRIVGADEAGTASNLISIESPLARALIGKNSGEHVEVDAPAGIKGFEILKVSFK